MNIQTYCAFPKEATAAVRSLEDACRQADGSYNELYLSNQFNVWPDMKAFFFAEQDGALAGILQLYGDNPEECEVYAYVRPELRRRGIFRALWQEARRELERFGYRRVLFKTDRGFAVRNPVPQHLGAVLSHSEEFLLRPSAPCPSALAYTVRPAAEADLPALAALQSEAFGEGDEEARRYVEGTLRTPGAALYVLEVDGVPAGCASVDRNGLYEYLYGVCVRRDLRGQGLGRALLAGVLTQLASVSCRDAALHVDCTNRQADRLYLSCGFQPRGVQEYYRLSL